MKTVRTQKKLNIIFLYISKIYFVKICISESYKKEKGKKKGHKEKKGKSGKKGEKGDEGFEKKNKGDESEHKVKVSRKF